MWESAILYSQSRSNMSPLDGTVTNHVCIISKMDWGGGEKNKSSYRGWIVNLETVRDTVFLTADLLLTLFSNLWSKCLFLYLQHRTETQTCSF